MLRKDEKILIYPYFNAEFPVAKQLIREGFEVHIASYEGTGLIGKDVAFSVNREKCNVKVSVYSNHLLDLSDVIYIPNISKKNLRRNEMDEILLRAMKNDKKIISAVELDGDFPNVLEYDNFIDLGCATNFKINSYYNRINNNKMRFFTPKIPVIYIGGIHDLMDNQYITISLKHLLEGNGYKVCCLTIMNSLKLFGCISFPKEFSNIGETIENRIIYLNNFIRSCVENMRPDILLIHIPDGMMRYNDYFTNSFGGFAFMISQAVKSDYFICTVVTEMSSLEYYDRLSNYFNRKFDSPINCLHFSNSLLDIPNSSRPTSGDLLFKNELEIDEFIDGLSKLKGRHNYKMLNLFKDESLELLFDDILNKLG